MKIKIAWFLLAAITAVVLFAAPDLMAIGNGPRAAEFSSNDYGIPYFGWLASIGGGLLGLLVIRRKYFRK